MSDANQTPIVPDRDVRVDQIGFVNELQTKYVDPIKKAVKARMLERASQLAAGDFFEGKLVTGGVVGTLDPRKVFRLVKNGKLTESQFLDCVKVERGKLEEFVSGKDLDRMSEFLPATPQLRVTRIKGVEVTLVDAIKALGKDLITA